ncbi:hypothetical protein [Lacticaseibacillus kribbianus]|uniref:hypothetical protein n=1 Tax=Lacticaseibacillus kribbianus TaxID=2926292 RepID=UPI001CD5029E|nr:hypothetical protein [Lacticaseibacillus kribbianus]
MRKILMIMMLLASLALALPLTPTPARAGGATGGGGTGGGGGTTGGGTTGGTGDTTTRRYDNDNNTSPITVFASFIVLTGGLGIITFKRNHPSAGRNAALTDTVDLDPDVARTFPALFDAMEDAWSRNDQAMLATLMTPGYFRKQKRLLNRWARQGRVNRLEGMTIIELAQEPSRRGLHVVVTAQGRDWFEYPAQSAAFNREQYDDAMIARFTEVWELTAIDNVWRVARIRQ